MKWTFSKSAQRLSHLGSASGIFPPWSCDAKSDPIEGHTPLENGVYDFGPAEYNDPGDSMLTAEGPYFIPVNRNNAKGCHGGGSAATHPLAAQQGWCQTEGCIRLQNTDLYHVVINLSPGDTLEVVD